MIAQPRIPLRYQGPVRPPVVPRETYYGAPPQHVPPKPGVPPAQQPAAAAKPLIPEPDKKFLERAMNSGAFVELVFLYGGNVVGQVLRFGLYSVALEVGGEEIVIYKHSIAMMREKRVTGEAMPG